MRKRTLGAVPAAAAIVATELAAIAALMWLPLWEVCTVTVTVLALATVTVHRRTAPGWAVTAARWRLNRRRPFDLPAAVDVTGGDVICGVRIGEYEAVAAIRLAGRPHRPTYLRGADAYTDDTVPLRILADALHQPGGLHLRIDVVSSGRRVRRSSGYPALYSTLLAARPAVGQRDTHLLIRLDMAASSTGLGYRASVGAALTAAAERITVRLRQAGIRAAVASAAELDTLLPDVLAAAVPPGEALRWGAVKTRDGYAATYYLSPQDITTATLTRLWGLHVEAVSTTLTLSKTDGALTVAAAVRVVTAQPPTQPPTLDVNTLPGRQYAALQWSAPIPGKTLPLPLRTLHNPDELTVPIGGCGVLIGAAADNDPATGVRVGDFVTLPLTDPVATTRIAMDVDAGYVRAVLARAAAIGERIIIHTSRPNTWAALNDPHIAVAREGRAPFVPTIIVNDHALSAPTQGLAAAMITLGPVTDADIIFTGGGDTVHVSTGTVSIDVEPITFLREQTWTG